ncbi:DNA topoisomerase 3-alpha-like [Liolophura sinensis]|uniref:DNA topoisomerase 3-alpha-like n=1 Tax=Liolophura sinensis TaxID=3198878 RepID=UPI0031580144
MHYYRNIRLLSAAVRSEKMVRVLNVAEKNDAAKCLAEVLSRGSVRKREGFSRFNKIYEFEYVLMGQNVTMTMTSVSGHLLAHEFTGQYKKWYGCNPVSLFDAQVIKYCPDNYKDIRRTLEREARGCQKLVIWTDGDREGENIGFEIIDVCKAVKEKIQVFRARFSEITPRSVEQACRNLQQPDRNVSDAVDVRSELDLRIGASFTRFQTLRLQKKFPELLADQLISYGSCQFPTLGFVVERYKQIQAFVPEPFWKIKVLHCVEDTHVEFSWKRNRLFNELACLVLYEHCIENPLAKVVDVRSKTKSKWRPQPLDTVELEKLASRKLKINAKETMKIAEKLYTQGYISYPRTETNMFAKDIHLASLVQLQTNDPNWGAFAGRVLEHGPNPRNGNKTDNAHPPIHPIKYAANLQGNEQRVYEFVVRHFLATCSQDAQGHETTVEIDVAEEKFSAQGLMIVARNYLDVYPYDRWNAKIIPVYNKGDSFQPNSIQINAGETSAPPLLTEADLIALMEKHGIGTDATHAEHIETIKSRMYVGVRPDGKFVPGQLGMGLVEGYDAMGYEMSKPHLRAELEADLKRICDGHKDKNVVLAEQVRKYKEVFIEASRNALKLDEALSQFLGAEAQPVVEQDQTQMEVSTVKPCPQCGQEMTLRSKKDGKGYYIGCMGYPDCRQAVWFPDFVLEASVENQTCIVCQPGPVHLIKFKFKRGSVAPMLPNEYVGCIGGCDQMLTETLNIKPFRPSSTSQSGTSSVRPTQSSSQSTLRTSQGVTPRGSNHVVNNGGVREFTSSASSNFGDSGYGNSFGLTQSLSYSCMDISNSTSFRTPQTARANMPGGSSTSGHRDNTRSPLSEMNGSLNSTHNMTSGGSQIVCNCGEDAVLLTVRKEGPNTGRQFHKCPKPSGSGCSFFLWADQRPDQSAAPSFSGHFNAAPSHRQSGPSGEGNCVCSCGLDAKLLTVQKDGANKGRQFYVCPKPREESCKFFQWADGEGHIRTKCPQKDM